MLSEFLGKEVSEGGGERSTERLWSHGLSTFAYR